ncbi:MAG: GAF domain-containing protein [Polaromonas sp.]|uniref:GAF domain-containing protein n=1 Tax=Polaromonas sp. TaxID=1869339 RepID=UPI0027342849|nr:GAF domain-containing protein [Polaromonas sp.]MDP2817757.1 GAF domain-containing protein [Polaromonas sp.]
MTERDERETLRQAALDRLHVVDSPEERAYDDITRLAADVCGTPMALISLSDHERQWFKSRVGIQVQELPRENSFCSHALLTPHDVMVIEDTAKDDRFASHPLVTGTPHIRFYAGAPLLTQAGHAMGAICVVDTVPRQLDAKQLQTLQFMAQQVMVMLESREPPGTTPVKSPN